MGFQSADRRIENQVGDQFLSRINRMALVGTGGRTSSLPSSFLGKQPFNPVIFERGPNTESGEGRGSLGARP